MIAPNAKGIRILVADDEAPARQRLIDLLRQRCTGQGRAGSRRWTGCRRHDSNARRRILFSSMCRCRELDGLEVVKAVGADAMPLTVFVTAYDQHAISAFEANALDYLLKPFSDERLEAALCRAKARHDERNLHEFGRNVLRMISAGPGIGPLPRSAGGEVRRNHALHPCGRH